MYVLNVKRPSFSNVLRRGQFLNKTLILLWIYVIMGKNYGCLEKSMHDLTYLNHFSFHEVEYQTYHESSFPVPTRYNFIMYLQKGVAHIITEKETILLEEGDILHIPRGSKYAVKLYGKPSILFGSYAYLNYQEKDVKSYRIQKVPFSSRLLELISKVSAINQINGESIGYFYLFLHELYKVLPSFFNDGKQSVLDRAMNFMMRKPDAKMRDVAEHCHASESTLYALFSERAHITPTQFKLGVKLEKAVNYLLSTDIPIEEISSLCGFSSSSYFRKKLYGRYQKTPSEIRKNGKGQILGF